jgi:hypothetical protein
MITLRHRGYTPAKRPLRRIDLRPGLARLLLALEDPETIQQALAALASRISGTT